jgi:hypothetical protein
MVPRVNGEEIQALVRERLVEEVVVKTAGWQGYSFLPSSPRRHQWLVPGSGKEAAKVLPWVHTVITNIKGNIRGVHHASVQSTCPVTWRNSVTASTVDSGNRKCLTGCFMFA